MRRSFSGASGGRGMGGGSSGGGSVQMLRSVQRAVRAGGVGGGASSQDPFSHSNTATANNSARRARKTPTTAGSAIKGGGLTLSTSSISSQNNLPISAAASASTAWPSSPTFSDAASSSSSSDWECVDVLEEDRSKVFHDDMVFGTVPSRDEVHHAVFALQEVLDQGSPTFLIKDKPTGNDEDANVAGQVTSPASSLHIAAPFGPKIDWVEPPSQLWRSNALLAGGSDRVYDAFHLLQNEPSVQRMVMSLSSDRAVWDAVLNNEVVQEIRETFNQDTCPSEKSVDEVHDASDPAPDFLNWIIVNTKAKVMEFIDKITKLVNGFLNVEEEEGGKAADEKKVDPFEQKLRASFFLSIMVMLIVIVTRSSKA